VGDVQHSLANIERGRIELGYQPKTDFRAGLEETVRWYLAESRSAIEHEMASVETPAFDLGRMNDMKEAQHVMQAYEGVR
jgi:dTDP-D-glucose 4,6-dehydratase